MSVDRRAFIRIGAGVVVAGLTGFRHEEESIDLTADQLAVLEELGRIRDRCMADLVEKVKLESRLMAGLPTDPDVAGRMFETSWKWHEIPDEESPWKAITDEDRSRDAYTATWHFSTGSVRGG